MIFIYMCILRVSTPHGRRGSGSTCMCIYAKIFFTMYFILMCIPYILKRNNIMTCWIKYSCILSFVPLSYNIYHSCKNNLLYSLYPTMSDLLNNFTQKNVYMAHIPFDKYSCEVLVHEWFYSHPKKHWLCPKMTKIPLRQKKLFFVFSNKLSLRELNVNFWKSCKLNLR